MTTTFSIYLENTKPSELGQARRRRGTITAAASQHTAGAVRGLHDRQEAVPVKFQVERDVLAEAVAWTAAPAARPPSRCWPVSASGGREQLTLSTLRLRGLGPGQPPGRSPTRRAPCWSPAGCWPRSSAACPPGRSRSVTDGTGRAHVRQRHVHPADHAGRRVPDAARHAAGRRARSAADVFARRSRQVAIAAGRDDTLPALTGVRMEIEGDTLTLVATDRYRLAVRELHWQPVKTDDLRPRCWCPPGCSPTRPGR